MVSAILSDQVGPLGAALKMFIKMSDFKAGLGWKAGVGKLDEICVAATLFFGKKSYGPLPQRGNSHFQITPLWQ